MSYLVLARKYRPRNFSEMAGQEHVVRALVNALQTQRLHHAYLFTGTRGVGKTTVSRILAKSLNCVGPDGQGGITAAPCGVCPACTEIDAGRFVDYTELDAASNRGVDEVQALLEQAVYKPVQGRFKVFMIDEVHMLTTHAFNAMLKTLEEPPEYLKFVLATTDPQKVPVTVLSRCLQFNLRPMAPETVREHLEHVLAAERIAAEPQALRLLARAAHGSMRDALSLTDQAIAYGNGALQEAGVRQMLGSVGREHVFALIDALAQGAGARVVEIVGQLCRDGVSAASTLEEMTALLQQMAVWQVAPGGSADMADTEVAELARLAALLPKDETQLLYKLCLHGREELGLAPDEYTGLTMVLLRLLAFKPAADARADTGAGVSAGASAGAANGVAEKKPPSEAPAPPARAAAASPLSTVATPAAAAPAVAAPRIEETATVAGVAPDGAVPEGAAGPAVDASGPEGGEESAPPPWDDPVPPALEAESVPATPPAVETVTAVAPPPRAQSRPPVREQTPAPVAPIPSSEEGDFWSALVTQLVAAETITALVRELALQSQLVARDAGQWLLRIESETLNQGTSRERLEQALAQAGYAVRLAIEVNPVHDSPILRKRAAAQARQRVAEEVIHKDPLVQHLMHDFGATIVPGSLRPA
ncbi:MAG: DNA polymerase III subunit gamma/tau [Burkholderiaceae bacterium]|jgi:DNA polymerase-3 subunit gamma/tau|nr:DNA polymerase III subunit gamma/tau [Burkholderiaceae bacterium]